MNARLKILISEIPRARSKSARALSESPDIVGRRIQFPDADLRGLRGQRDPLFELAQGRLLLEQIGDIHAGAHVAPEIAMRSGARDALISDPAILPVMPPHAVLGHEGLAGLERVQIRLRRFLAIVGVNDLAPAMPKFLLESSSGKLEPRFVEVGAELVFARHPDQDGRGVGHASETILAFLQGRLGPAPADAVE